MNNRELATFILLGAGLLVLVRSRDGRQSLASIGKQLCVSKLTPLFGVYVAIVAGALWCAHSLGLWTSQLVGATILWFLFVGFAWFINLGGAGTDPDFFKRRLFEVLGLAAFFEFFLNAQALPLAAEIVLQLVLLLFVGVDVVASRNPEQQAVAKLASAVIITITSGLLIYTIVRLATDWSSIDKEALANELLMPIWLTLAVIPYLYVVAFYMGYELLFTMLAFVNGRKPPTLRARLGIVLGLRGALVDVDQFRGLPAREAAQSRSIRGAIHAVRRFKQERAADAAARAVARQTLVDNAGRQGVYENGLVLDRREFAETKKALDWLATCHMGWYRNEDRPDEYRADLLDVLIGSHQLDLPSDAPIVTRVRKDKQAWYAYRKTPSGHIFGIGASGPPPSQWHYDGPMPPSGYPAKGSVGWTDVMSPIRPEWRTEPKT